ncbi:MAG: acyltransferase [Azoarcus sp.]|jgi:galactoside O-acetyltransferase|nr:acyltransferase [Azoarcus sp.]
MDSFYTADELQSLGLKAYGENVKISRKASLYGAGNIEIGHDVRIDDFCILSGKIKLCHYIHIAAQSLLFGGNTGVTMENFSGLSSRCAIYAESDDYSGNFLSNAACPAQYRSIQQGKVLIGQYAIIGSGVTVLPGVNIAEGAAIGAMSLVLRDAPPWTINAGIPCRVIKARSKKAIELGQTVLQHLTGEH